MQAHSGDLAPRPTTRRKGLGLEKGDRPAPFSQISEWLQKNHIDPRFASWDSLGLLDGPRTPWLSKWLRYGLPPRCWLRRVRQGRGSPRPLRRNIYILHPPVGASSGCAVRRLQPDCGSCREGVAQSHLRPVRAGAEEAPFGSPCSSTSWMSSCRRRLSASSQLQARVRIAASNRDGSVRASDELAVSMKMSAARSGRH
jgi:hypothetical protein